MTAAPRLATISLSKWVVMASSFHDPEDALRRPGARDGDKGAQRAGQSETSEAARAPFPLSPTRGHGSELFPFFFSVL